MSSMTEWSSCVASFSDAVSLTQIMAVVPSAGNDSCATTNRPRRRKRYLRRRHRVVAWQGIAAVACWLIGLSVRAELVARSMRSRLALPVVGPRARRGPGHSRWPPRYARLLLPCAASVDLPLGPPSARGMLPRIGTVHAPVRPPATRSPERQGHSTHP